MFRIAHNRGVSHLARRRPISTALTDEVEIADAGPTPEQTLVTEQQGQRLLTAVQSLSVGYRQVVTLMLEGLSYAEIAEVLGISETNVGARLTRARQLLRKALEKS